MRSEFITIQLELTNVFLRNLHLFSQRSWKMEGARDFTLSSVLNVVHQSVCSSKCQTGTIALVLLQSK